MITILFSCEECGLEDVAIKVRARGSKDDVVRWMEDIVINAIYLAHQSRSPYCQAKQVTNIKIPIDKDDPT